jgi:carbamoyl-phosphate synthase small subunit
MESAHVFAAGLIIRDLAVLHSNFRATESLPEFMRRHKLVGIAGIDTRRLTRLLREQGAQDGCILALEKTGKLSVKTALKMAHAFPGLKGMDLAKVVSTKKSYSWNEGLWELGQGFEQKTNSRFHVVAYDFGIKRNILRMLTARGCRLTVIPAQTSATEVLKMKPDGVFLSNGPGDPEPCSYAIDAIKKIIETGLPVFGICLGHQLLGLASGARTIKMKFGHHGANHPVLEIDTGRVMITSQNHGFAVDEASLPSNLRVTHRSLFDNSVQGLERSDKPAFCFQGHPEASPGPHDIASLFDRFIEMMQKWQVASGKLQEKTSTRVS